MGKQIGFLQTQKDYNDLICFILEIGEFLTLPSLIQDLKFKSIPLNECNMEHYLFFETATENILRNHFSLNADGVYSTRGAKGYFLEMEKSQTVKVQHPNMNFRFGRVYFNTRYDSENEEIKQIKKLYNRIVYRIKTTYPLMEDWGRSPRYIGPDLAKQIESGKFKPRSRNISIGDRLWKPKTFTTNPKVK